MEQASDISKIIFSFIIYACCLNKTTKTINTLTNEQPSSHFFLTDPLFIRNYFKHIFFRFISIKIEKINEQMKAFSKSFHLSAIPFSQLFSFGHSVTLKLTYQLRFALRSYFFCNPRFRPPGTLFNTAAKRIELQQRDWSQLKALSKGFHYLVWFFSFCKF